MNTKSQVLLGVGITVGVIVLLVVGGVAGVLIYKELQPEPVARSIVINAPVGSPGSGAIIESVKLESPADEAGLRQGDVILTVDGEAIDSTDKLADLVGSHDPGDVVTLTILRAEDGKEQDLTVTLGEDPEAPGQAYLGVRYAYPAYARMRGYLPQGQDRLMMPFPDLPEILKNYDELKDKLHFLPGCEGVEDQICGLVIAEVAAGSPAEEAGLLVGDLILSVDGDVIASQDMFVDLIRSHDPGDDVSLSIFRIDDDERVDVDVILGEHPDEAGSAYLGVVVPGFYHHFELGEGPHFHGNAFPFHFELFPEETVTPEL